jgi:hypothetical protein
MVLKLNRIPVGSVRLSRMFGKIGAPLCVGERLTLI